MLQLTELQTVLSAQPKLRIYGRVAAVRGPLILARMPHAAIGQMCHIRCANGRWIQAQVIAFQDDLISLAPLDHLTGISPGAELHSAGDGIYIRPYTPLAGQVLDALGTPISLKNQSETESSRLLLSVDHPAPNPLLRQPICQPLATGVKVIDGLCPIGRGQRIGLFSAAGIGKSTLLGMIARHSAADINVIALVAERGREVNDFIHAALGKEGLKKSVIVVATSDESPARRQLAAFSATSIAEYFRAQGKHVMLMVDSITRTARAIREVGLAAGEFPVRQGYTSSVYTTLPRLIERAGTDDKGSITAIYTVLTAGENDLDPLGEELKSLLDGHIVLDSRVAAQGVRPAVDLTQSVSRLAPQLLPPHELEDMRKLVEALHRLKRDRDIVLFGGAPDAELAAALAIEPALKAFLNQVPAESTSWQASRTAVKEIADKWRELNKVDASG